MQKFQLVDRKTGEVLYWIKETRNEKYVLFNRKRKVIGVFETFPDAFERGESLSRRNLEPKEVR